MKKNIPKVNASGLLKSTLRAAGHKATPARVAILRTLAAAKRPMNITAMRNSLGEIRTDQATVYRSLEALEASGLIRRVDLRHGHAHYELVGQDDHHHLVCLVCGLVEDFTGCGIDAVIKKTLRQSKQFANVDEHALELFGLCKTCAKKKRVS